MCVIHGNTVNSNFNTIIKYLNLLYDVRNILLFKYRYFRVG